MHDYQWIVKKKYSLTHKRRLYVGDLVESYS